MLAAGNPDDGVLARNARPVLAAVSERLRAAPSLPYTDPVTESVTGLAPDDLPGPAGAARGEDRLEPADAVRAAVWTWRWR